MNISQISVKNLRSIAKGSQRSFLTKIAFRRWFYTWLKTYLNQFRPGLPTNPMQWESLQRSLRPLAGGEGLLLLLENSTLASALQASLPPLRNTTKINPYGLVRTDCDFLYHGRCVYVPMKYCDMKVPVVYSSTSAKSHVVTCHY